MSKKPCDFCEKIKTCTSNHGICKKYMAWFSELWDRSCEEIATACGKDIWDMREAAQIERTKAKDGKIPNKRNGAEKSV